MRYLPLADRVIVEPIEENRLTPGGILVPDIALHHKYIAYGTVVAVGTGRVNAEGKTVPLALKVGDTVSYPRKAPAYLPLIRDDGREDIVHLMREAEIACVVEGLPRATKISGVDGRLLSMLPASRAEPDSAIENRELLDEAARAGWDDTDGEDQAI